jgi:hypothetical protein
VEIVGRLCYIEGKPSWKLLEKCYNLSRVLRNFLKNVAK